MSWLRLDNGFPDHPKVSAAGDLAGWLYLCGLAYASRMLTDGFIPAGIVPRLTGLENPEALAAKLVAVKLWEKASGGYKIHDYLVYQVPSSRVESDRAASRTRVAAWRANNVRPSNGDVTPLQLPLDTDVDKDEPEETDKEPPLQGGSVSSAETTLSTQAGWRPRPDELLKLQEIARGRGLDLEIEVLKMAGWLASKGGGRACDFGFAANWLSKEGRNGHATTRRVSGRNGEGPRTSAAGSRAHRAGSANPFAQYERADPGEGGTDRSAPAAPG